jgi:hypothetical protein
MDTIDNPATGEAEIALPANAGGLDPGPSIARATASSAEMVATIPPENIAAVPIPPHLAAMVENVSAADVVSAFAAGKPSPASSTDTSIYTIEQRLQIIEGALFGPAANNPIIQAAQSAVLDIVEPKIAAVVDTVASHNPWIGKVEHFFTNILGGKV